MQLTVTPAEACVIDLLDELRIDTDRFAAVLTKAVRDGKPHPLTRAASHVESASFQTPVERGEIAAPEPTF